MQNMIKFTYIHIIHAPHNICLLHNKNKPYTFIHIYTYITRLILCNILNDIILPTFSNAKTLI